MADTETPAVPFFKKKGRGRPTTSRKRSLSPSTAAAAAASSSSSSQIQHPSQAQTQEKSHVVLPTRKTAGNLLSAGTKRTISQRNANAHGGDSGDNDDEDEGRRDGPDVKWTAAGSHVHAALEILEGDEAEALLEAKRRKVGNAEADEEGGLGADDGLYRGQKGYAAHIRKNKEVPKAMRVGPQRSTNSTIRTVTMMDYQPDVCKDYKETGFCGYGDTCKFLHDRGTYLQGWQLDKLAAEPKRAVGGESESASESEDEIPFACLLCRKPYTDPVATRCGHYFCSRCAIRRFAKTPKCAACGAPTGGIFNRADKVIAKLKKKQEAAAEADGDEDGDGEEAGGGGAGGVAIEGLGE